MQDDTPRTARPSAVLRRGLAHPPRPLLALAALAAAALGIVLLIRPTTSLGVLALLIGAGLVLAGVLELAGRPARIRVILSLAWIVLGLVVLLHRGLTVRMLALVIGVSLIVRGVVGALAAFRRTPRQTLDGRIAGALLGVAGVLFGATALAWPDITLLIAGVVFGAALIWAGVAVLIALVRTHTKADTDKPPTVLRRWLRTIGAVAAVALAVGVAAVGIRLGDGSGVTDDFYAAPQSVPDEPGELLRAEEFARGIPADARAWRILYTTTHGDDSPAIASGLVVVPRAGTAHPVIAWNHGTTGFDETCAPTLEAQPLESGAFFAIDEVVAEGWALVATDYIGLGTHGPHPYLVGADSARAELDAVRAARQLDGVTLGGDTTLWGHSQGGGSALWVGAIAAEYAPDVPLSGVVALAPASDLVGLVAALDTISGGSVFASFVIAGYAGVYPDVRRSDYIRPGAEELVRQMSSRCLTSPGTLVSVLSLLLLSADPDILARDPSTGALGQRLRENIPPPSRDVPILLGQGEADGLVHLEMQDGFVAAQCQAGAAIDYRTYPGLDHIPLVERGSPAIDDLFAWTREAFAGSLTAVPC